jgi:hypothetical protein
MMNNEQLKLGSQLTEEGTTMDEELSRLVGAAFLAGLQTCKAGGGRRMPRAAESRRPSKIHKIPRRPIQIDGERCAPERVLRFNGRPLHWVLDVDAYEGRELSVFSQAEYASEFRKSAASALLKRFTDNKPTAPPESSNAPDYGAMAQGALPIDGGGHLWGEVILYEHADFLGSSWGFSADWGSIPNFLQVYPTAWWSTDINDRVSSVRNDLEATGATGLSDGKIPWVILYQDINYGGSTLSIPGGKYASRWNAQGGLDPTFGEEPNLGSFWNDLASSLSYDITDVP